MVVGEESRRGERDGWMEGEEWSVGGGTGDEDGLTIPAKGGPRGGRMRGNDVEGQRRGKASGRGGKAAASSRCKGETRRG